MLTETDDLAAAIDAAAPRYAGESRAAVLRHLVRLGAEAVAAQQQGHRLEATERAGRYPGLYPAGHLRDLRAEGSQ